MVNTQALQGHWNELKGKIRQKWGQLTNDDVQSFDGGVDQLIGLIQRKTGETRHTIESFLEELSSNGASSIGKAAEAVRTYAQDAADTVQKSTKQAAETVQKTGRQAMDSMNHRLDEAQSMVRERPGEAAAVCFGTGLVFGVVLGLLLRSK